MSAWPKALKPAHGPFPFDKLEGAALGMGEFGDESRALFDDGFVPPDMMTGLTLFLLSNQPKTGNEKMPGGGGGVAGGVWVRERYSLHRPLARDDEFIVTGESVGRHVHKSRRYGTTRSETHDAHGNLVARNLTTGLLAYKVEDGLADALEGADPDTLESPQPDWSCAGQNPGSEALRSLTTGEVLGDYPVLVSLAMMQARDTKKPDNPIHSDPELARKAGLSRPIAGGSHVQSFALEPILARVGRQALFYGASFDIRWKSPVHSDVTIVPIARVTERTDEKVVFDIETKLEDGTTTMTGRIVVPLA